MGGDTARRRRAFWRSAGTTFGVVVFCCTPSSGIFTPIEQLPGEFVMAEMAQPSGDGSKGVHVRLAAPQLAALERWRGRQLVIPSRPQAIRELIRKSLDNPAPDGVEP
jgi:hypothetical protein